MADDLGVDAKVVKQMEGRMSSYDMAFDADADADDDIAYRSPANYLQDTDSDMAASIEAQEWEENKNNSLYHAMDGLDERSKDIIMSRWLSEQKATLHELAAKYSVSAERIRQLEKNAMEKVKNLIQA